MTGEVSANPIGVIARSDSDSRVKPEGMRGNLLKSAPIKGVAASLSLLAMTTGGNDNLKRAAIPAVIMRTAGPRCPRLPGLAREIYTGQRSDNVQETKK
jgi:hypothetical protein